MNLVEMKWSVVKVVMTPTRGTFTFGFLHLKSVSQIEVISSVCDCDTIG